MPWKTTKLAFCGFALRRRTLYALTLVFTIAGVPALSWALLVLGGKFSRSQEIGFLSAAFIVPALALNGWRLILKHNIELFWEEARVIWPGSVLFLLTLIWLAYAVADSVFKRGRMDYIVPLVFGGVMLIVLLVRCARLSQYPKRSSLVRRHRHSRSGLPGASPPEETVAAEPVEDNDEGPEPPAGDFPS